MLAMFYLAERWDQGKEGNPGPALWRNESLWDKGTANKMGSQRGEGGAKVGYFRDILGVFS